MQKVFFLLLFLLFTGLNSNAQDFEKVDALVSLYPNRVDSPEVLAKFIARDFKKPMDQLRAAYSWLIHNIEYDPQEYYKFKFQYRILEERNQKTAASREMIIKRTVQNGRAVCEGYALTLERLCELLDINGYVVRGDTKTRVSDIERSFDKNHMWMVAVLDQKAILLDPTWGAGRYDERFIKAPSYFYFNTAHELFLNTHMPEVFADAYVPFKLSRENFSKRPLLILKDLKHKDVLPKSGVLRAKELAKGIRFAFPYNTPSKVYYVIDNAAKQPVDFEADGNLIRFDIATKEKGSSLVIYADEQPIIGYKIKK